MPQCYYIAPPILTTDIDYEVWKKEMEIWRLFTSLTKRNKFQLFFEFDRSS